MKGFSQNFFESYKKEIIGYSCLRIVSFVQVLFWPYALSRVINIMTRNPQNWKQALVWAILMVGNKITEDVVRLRSKLGLETIASELQIKLSVFLSENTRLKKGVKTGEAVQAIKTVSEAVYSLMLYYKEHLLQLPVNLIVIPLVLLGTDPNYLIILMVFAGLYLLGEYLFSKKYNQKLEEYLRASEIFWGTTYRKVPDIWRQRQDVDGFDKTLKRQGKKLDKATDGFTAINNWRWVVLQVVSSASMGSAVFYVLYRSVNGLSPIGDLILITGYLSQIHSSLNIISSALSKVSQTRLALDRLNKTVKIKT